MTIKETKIYIYSRETLSIPSKKLQISALVKSIFDDFRIG